MTRGKPGRLRWLGLVVLAFVACRDFSHSALSEEASSNAGAAGMPGDSEIGGGPETQAGTTGQVSDGGDGGDAGNAGVGGSGDLGGAGAASDLGGAGQGPGGEPLEPPFCENGTLSASTDISNALTGAGNPYVLFMTQPMTSALDVTWNVGSNWVAWGCDAPVPHPKRVAAGNGADLNLQIYTLSTHGALYIRQQAGNTFYPWATIALPAEVTAADDVALRPRELWLASPQGVFRRSRSDNESHITAPKWSRLLEEPATRLAAEYNQGGVVFVVMLDAKGQASVSVDIGSGIFSVPMAVDYAEPLVDVDAGYDSLTQPQMFAVTSGGALIARRQMSGIWESWQLIADASTAHHLKAVSVHSQAPADPYVFGIGDADMPYMSKDGGKTWQARY